MGKLHDLLYAIIDRVNKSVKTTAQAFSEEEKTQVRANIGAMPSTYVPPNQTAQQVGADPKGTAAAAVSEHNTSPTSHEDIRSIITGLTERLNALANSDDTTLDQMKEVVDYIKDNRELIESVTTSKVNVTDIINNLTSNISNKPLSAAQGVILKGLIDTLSAEALRTSDVVNNLTSSSTTKPLSAYQGNILRKMIESAGGGGGIALEGAKANQYPVIKAVDASGKPTEWEAADRTHWKEVIGADMTVLAETSVRFTNSTATVSGFVAGAIKEGQTYTVNWNGTEYPCKAYLDDGIVHLGNSALAGGSVTTDDPFCIVGAGATCMVFKNTENTETITLNVDGVAQVVYHKLPQEYLPDGVPYCIEGNMVEVLPETTIATEEDMAALPSLGLMAGNDYVVGINGSEYTCTAFILNAEGLTGVALGNTLAIGGEDNGYPFIIADLSPETAAQAGLYVIIQPITEELTSPLAVSIHGKAAQLRKLDNRCLDMDYLKSALNAVSGSVELDLVDGYNAGTVTFGSKLEYYIDGTQIIYPITSKIIGGARLLLTFKYNLGSSDQTYHGYVTQWWVDEKWGQAQAYFPVADSSDGLYFAWINLDPETSRLTIRLIKTSATTT